MPMTIDMGNGCLMLETVAYLSNIQQSQPFGMTRGIDQTLKYTSATMTGVGNHCLVFLPHLILTPFAAS